MPHDRFVATTSTTRSRRHDRTPVLITAAPRSPAEEFAARRRRYSLIMGMRIPCLVLAGIVGIGFGLTGLAAVLVVASVPLPWIAVLIANDGPPRTPAKVARNLPQATTPSPAMIEAPIVIDMPRDDTAPHAA